MVWTAVELEDVGDQLVGAFQNPGILIGIPLALLGAVFMSFGAQYQHRGVTKVERLSGSHSSGGLGAGHLLKLLADDRAKLQAELDALEGEADQER